MPVIVPVAEPVLVAARTVADSPVDVVVVVSVAAVGAIAPAGELFIEVPAAAPAKPVASPKLSGRDDPVGVAPGFASGSNDIRLDDCQSGASVKSGAIPSSDPYGNSSGAQASVSKTESV